MAISLSSNIQTTGDLQEYLADQVVRNYMDKRFFVQFGKEHLKPDGYDSVRIFTTKDMEDSTASSTEWVTPSATAFTYTPTDITLTQYINRVEFSDIALEDSAIDLLTEAAFELGNDVARKLDKVYQDVVDAGTNVIYSSVSDASAGRTNVDAGDIMDIDYIAQASAELMANDAPKFDGAYYIAVMHPKVAHDLRKDAGAAAFVDVNKYTDNVDKIFRGELGALHGVRIVESSNVQFYEDASDGAGSTGNVDVYPTFVFGKDAFHHAMSGGIQTFYKPLGSGNDPANQRANLAYKVRFGAKIIKEAGLYRIESASSIGANS